MFFAFECIKCGKFVKKFLTKGDMKRKLEKVQKFNRYLGELMTLTARTKRVVFEFSDSKLEIDVSNF